MYRIRKSRKYNNVFYIYRGNRRVGKITGGMESIVYIPTRGKFVFKIYPGKIPEMFKRVAETTSRLPKERYTIAEKKYEVLKRLPSRTCVVGKNIYEIVDFAGLFYGHPTEFFKKRVLSKSLQRNNVLRYLGFLEEVPVLVQKKITGRSPDIPWKETFEVSKKMGVGDLTKKNIIKKKGTYFIIDFLTPKTSERVNVSPEIKEEIRLGFFRRLIKPKPPHKHVIRKSKK